MFAPTSHQSPLACLLQLAATLYLPCQEPDEEFIHHIEGLQTPGCLVPSHLSVCLPLFGCNLNKAN